MKNKPIIDQILDIKSDHPYWGYRRIWAYLKYRKGITVNKKRIYTLMKKHNLLVTKNMRLKARRANYPSKPRAEKPNEIWGIDMTKIMISGYGWLYLVVVMDWYTKKIVGYDIATRSQARDWLRALNIAVNVQFPEGIREKSDLKLVSDNGNQPTSVKFMEACDTLKIKQIFTSYNNPRGNADTERVIRTLKEDLVWPNDWQDPYLFIDALDIWIRNYNTDYPHSTLKWKTPDDYEKEFYATSNKISA